VKKVFGIVLALALVLSMSVMAAPAGAAISNVTVTQTNPIAATLSTYNISFVTQEPVDINDVIDITFPVGTNISNVPAAVVTVGGIDRLTNLPASGVCGYVLYPAPPGVNSNSIRITVAGFDYNPGPMWVEITLVRNGAPCHQTLTLGTTAETAVQSASYPIYLFNISLSPGWNLISLPGIPESTDIEVVLAGLMPAACEPHDFQVWYYDCGQWYVYCYDTEFETLTEMDECRAYWIYIDHAASFMVKGTWYQAPPDPPYKKKCYHECWNLVGFTSANLSKNFTTYTASLVPAGSIIYWYGWNAATQTWEICPAKLSQGKGYWMAFMADACFVPPL